MVSKKTNDTKDQEIWRCRKSHTVVKGNCKYTMKDVKLTIRHESWLVDSKLPLQYIVELMYLWSQSFSVDEIMHELKLSKKTVVEWANFFRESCFTTNLEASEQIGGNGVEVEIDESKVGKRKYYRGHLWKANGYLEVVKNTKSIHDSCKGQKTEYSYSTHTEMDTPRQHYPQ